MQVSIIYANMVYCVPTLFFELAPFLRPTLNNDKLLSVLSNNICIDPILPILLNNLCSVNSFIFSSTKSGLTLRCSIIFSC